MTDAGVKKVILLVDDEFGFRHVYRDVLEYDNFEILEASDGDEAWRLALEKKPDLILLDLVLPKLPGLEVLKRVRSTPETKNIPVIILSVLGEPRDIEKGMQLGANDYMVKGQNTPAEVIEKVGKLLGTAK